MRRALPLVLAFASACERVEADEGTDALFQVEGAQFRRGPMPIESGGPRVLSTSVGGLIPAGAVNRAAIGELEAPATAVAIGLAADVGYWIVPAAPPVFARPDAPTFSAPFGLSPRARAGRHALVTSAVDGRGRFGPRALTPLEVIAAGPPAGRLVVSLLWQNQADLDLHLVLPSGVEIFKRSPTEYHRPPPGSAPPTDDAPASGGALDRDSNAQCRSDGQAAENVVFAEEPPKGRYLVRVDTFSLCGAASAPWRVEARLDGVRVGAAQGTSTEEDLRFGHDRGAGVLALDFVIP